MLKPHSGAYYQAQQDRSSALRESGQWKSYARQLENDLREWKDWGNSKEAQVAQLNAVINDNAAGNRLASTGITVAGFTNNLAQEMLLLRHNLVRQYAGDGNHQDIALPFGQPGNRAAAYARLTMQQRKEINLRLLCRAEWYDWCLHTDALAKFGALLADAFLNQSPENAHIRNRKLVEAYKEESRLYHAARERAMDVRYGDQERAQFEAERYHYWKGRIHYMHNPNNNNCPVPSPTVTRQHRPGERFDLHLPAGRLARDFGVNIATGQKADCYREKSAASLLSGQADNNGTGWYI